MDGNKFPYEWIETLPRLEGIARILGQANIIGVDLEADSLYHYFEKVCLLQIATESASYVIDPLALKRSFRFTSRFLQSPHPQSIPRGGL